MALGLSLETGANRDLTEGSFPRFATLLVSLGLHLAVLFALTTISGSSPQRKPVRYDVVLISNPETQTSKVIWYTLRDVSPNGEKSESPKGRDQSAKDTIVADAPAAKTGAQFVWQPIPAPPVEQTVEAPNVVAISGPPQPAPKLFVPPPQSPANNPPTALLDVVGLPSPNPEERTSEIAPKALLPVQITAKAPVKPFVLPSGTAARKASGDVVVGAPPELAGGGTKSNVTAVIAGLNPSATLTALPPGSRPADFSVSLQPGAPSVGSATRLTVPHFTVHEGKTLSTAAPTPSQSIIKELKLPAALTMSAPLRAGSRRVPGLVEARFPGRTAYVLVIARPELPEYAGDWTVWFAEVQETPGGNPQVQPPYPLRKAYVPVPGPGAGEGSTIELWIPLAAVIRQDGSVDSVRPLKPAPPGVAEMATSDLRKWVFRPATRNSKPIDVEAVVEIPFRVPGSR